MLLHGKKLIIFPAVENRCKSNFSGPHMKKTCNEIGFVQGYSSKPISYQNFLLHTKHAQQLPIWDYNSYLVHILQLLFSYPVSILRMGLVSLRLEHLFINIQFLLDVHKNNYNNVVCFKVSFTDESYLTCFEKRTFYIASG